MRVYLFLAIGLLFFQSCKKTQDLVNELEDTYWTNVQNAVIHFQDGEAYVEQTGSSNLGSNSNVFNTISTPFIRNITQTASGEWTGEIVRVTYSGNIIQSINYQPTTIKLSAQGNTKTLVFSVADNNMGFWTLYQGNPSGGGSGTPTYKDTTSVVTYDNSNTFKAVTYNASGTAVSTFIPASFPVRSGWYELSNNLNKGYGYRIIAYVNGSWEAVYYFNTKPTVSGIYKATAGNYAFVGVDPSTVAMSYLSVFYPSSSNNQTVNVTVNNGKITVAGTDIITSSSYSQDTYRLTFNISGK